MATKKRIKALFASALVSGLLTSGALQVNEKNYNFFFLPILSLGSARSNQKVDNQIKQDQEDKD